MKVITKAGIFLILASVVFAENAGYLSPAQMVLSGADGYLYVAQSGSKRVDVLDGGNCKLIQSIGLDLQPTGIALSKDGGRLFVTGGVSNGRVVFYDLTQQKIVGDVAVGHSPISPVLSPDGGVLYVCNRFSNRVSVIDIASASVVTAIPVVREPVAAVLAADGAFLFVANHLPAGAADADYTSAQISVIDTAARKQIKTIALSNGSTGLRGMCISGDGRFAYVTHILARYQLPTTQLDRGWMNTNAVSIIDVGQQTLYSTFLLDDVDHGAANPWGIACSPDGRYLCVTQAGTNELSVIDRVRLHQKLDDLAAGKKVSNVITSFEDVSRDLSFLIDIRKRVQLGGQGARALSVTDKHAFVAQYYSDSIALVGLSQAAPTSEFTLNPDFKMTPERQGEIFFNDASLCFQKWQSCASCHPDGRTDGLNWDLLNDGIGNPKNTKNMLLAHQTPPAMVTGIRDKAETAVRAGIRYIQFAQRPEEDAVAIDAYLKSLKPVESPYLENGQLSESAKRGEQLYQAAGCARCHSGAALTNQKMYNVETGLGREKGTAFDTPTLVEVWRTAPYLNRGQAATMKEVLVDANGNDRHGKTSSLTEEELRDLIEYILSL